MQKYIPVVVVKDVDEARKVFTALLKDGIPCAEVTFRTACAEDAIRLCASEFPQMEVGAGTVINAEQCKRAIAAGAKFIVSPGLSVEVAKVCKKKNIPYIPGCVTPTEIMQAISLGITTVKFFPASVYGGLKAIKALAAPFNEVTFMPTGGVNEENLSEFLSFKKIIACGGSWMVDGKLIKEGRFDEIASLAKKAREIAAKTEN